VGVGAVSLFIQDKLPELVKVCKRRRVRRLALFGSAGTEHFDPAASDLDFLVEFVRLSPAEHAENYFGLQEDLERLFGRAVDLVELAPIRNPYFLKVVEDTQVPVYVAA
jgi:predicted nucleotidyltransferase